MTSPLLPHVQRLLHCLEHVRPSGSGWTARTMPVDLATDAPARCCLCGAKRCRWTPWGGRLTDGGAWRATWLRLCRSCRTRRRADVDELVEADEARLARGELPEGPEWRFAERGATATIRLTEGANA